MIKSIIQPTTQTDLWTHCTRLVCSSALCRGYLLLAKSETALVNPGIQLINSKNIPIFLQNLSFFSNEKDLLNCICIYTLLFLNAIFWYTIICKVPFNTWFPLSFLVKNVYYTLLGKDFKKSTQLEIQIDSLWLHRKYDIPYLPSSDIFLVLCFFQSSTFPLCPSWVLDRQQYML